MTLPHSLQALPDIHRVGIVGAGSWGTALAIPLADQGFSVQLFAQRPEIVANISDHHRNERYLPGRDLSPRIEATLDFDHIASCDLVLLVVPSGATRSVAERLRSAGLRSDAILLSCSKGIELDTGLRMHEVLQEVFPTHPVAVLSGPSHAEEVAARLPTAAVVGAHDKELARCIQSVFTLPWFRCYTSSDVGGIETGGAVKNVFAIAAGIIDGLGLGDNAKAAMVTRGLVEMTRLGVALGGKPETFRGLSGTGDLIVTCYSEHSRNHRVGRFLGQGMGVAEAVASLGQVAEGVPNSLSIYRLARKLGTRTPIIDQVYEVIHLGKSARQSLVDLLSRDPRPESDEEDSD